jgi:hypothetical protein
LTGPPRLKAEIWAKAYIRRCAVEDIPAFITRRGDETSGIVLIRINTLDGYSTIFTPARQGDGTQIWMRGTGSEPVSDADANAYIDRQAKYDPDLWVIEVEDRDGRHFLENVEQPD